MLFTYGKHVEKYRIGNAIPHASHAAGHDREEGRLQAG